MMRTSGAAVACAAALAVVTGGIVAWAASRPDTHLHVTVLNVGSAPAVLVQTAGATSLIDGGSSPSALVQSLGRVLPPFAGRIDTVIVTGGEQSAVAGLAGLIGHYSVSTLLVPAVLTPGAAAVVNELVSAGADAVGIGDTQWMFGGARWRCLRYHAQTTDRDDCVITAATPATSLMVLGTAGTADQDELAAMYPAVRADIVVSPPGGAMSAALLAVTTPRTVAVPVAAGAPTAPAPSGVVTERTGADGDLAFTDGLAEGANTT